MLVVKKSHTDLESSHIILIHSPMSTVAKFGSFSQIDMSSVKNILANSKKKCRDHDHTLQWYWILVHIQPKWDLDL